MCIVPVIPIDVRFMSIEWSLEERSSSASIIPFILRIVRISLDIVNAVYVFWNEDMRFGISEGLFVILNKKLVVSLGLFPQFCKISTGLILGDNC